MQLAIQGLDGKFELNIHALSFPNICSPIASRAVDVTEYPHLDGLVFADDNCEGDECIDILVGADYYYELVTGEVVKGECGPTAVYSKLGWLLIGPIKSDPKTEVAATANLVIETSQLPDPE